MLNGQYLPGYKGGGPIRSCVNMVENLSDKFEFYVLCADRDFKADKPYENIKVNDWNQVGLAKVFYMSPERQSLKGFKEILNKTDYDILYLNGFFSPIFTIKPLLLLKLGYIKKSKVILTPRGDFTGGCENKKIKKYTYIYISKLMGLYKSLIWHATSEIEVKDIEKKFPHAKSITVSNLPSKFEAKETYKKKIPGELKLVFVSRIFPKKNIKYALEVLKEVKEGYIVFDIYGPMEDKSYWKECEASIKTMPSNVKVQYCGEAEHKDIPHIFEQYHAFFFPTLGENYGHVIVEAMMNNCLCILSKDVTPWDEYIEELNMGAELSNPDKFVEIIKRMVNANQYDINRMLEVNNSYIKKKTDSNHELKIYQEMLGGN